MTNVKKSDNIKLGILINAVKNDNLEIKSLCKEFDLINPKTHKSKFNT